MCVTMRLAIHSHRDMLDSYLNSLYAALKYLQILVHIVISSKCNDLLLINSSLLWQIRDIARYILNVIFMTGFHLQIIGIYLGSDARHNREGKICRFLEFACRSTLSVVCFRPRDADGFPSLPQESGAAGLSSQKSSTAPVSPGAVSRTVSLRRSPAPSSTS